MALPATKFYNGENMPLFGYGTWLARPGEVGAGVQKALESGYKHMDCASVYCNENEVGESFHKFFTSNKREDIFITSKLWVKDFGNVRQACEKTLKDLQLSYLDLYLIHLPFELEKDLQGLIPSENGVGVIGYTAERIQEVWKEMEKLVDDGLVKSIGISNFTIRKTKDLLDSSPRIKPACNQVELHPYLPQNKLVEYCNSNDIVLVAFSPLGNPGFGTQAMSMFEDPVIKSVATKHNATPAQVLISWGIHRRTGVLVKSVKESRIIENLASLKINLSKEDMDSINNIATRHRYVDQQWARKAGENTEDLWDGEYLAQ